MLLHAWLLAANLGAQTDSVVYKKPNEIRILIQRAAQRPAIDGRLDDEVWKLARPLTRFVQYEPVDSVAPPTQSVGWVTYDAQYLYVAFRAYEPDRRNIRASMHARERGVGPEDKVSIAIDTYICRSQHVGTTDGRLALARRQHGFLRAAEVARTLG